MRRIKKKIKVGEAFATVGVAFGKQAKRKTDKAYIAFRKSTRNTFLAMIAKAHAPLSKTVVQEFNGIEYDRLIAFGGQWKQFTVLIGIENGRCVAYWFLGRTACFPAFRAGLGRAVLVFQ